MTQTITHTPRLAWDCARAIINAITAGYYPWLGNVVGDRLGPDFEQQMQDSCLRLTDRPENVMVEAGLWRARLQDLLTNHPEARGDVAEIIRDVTNLLYVHPTD